jgi:pimeloyl-ACP methyl ester carboxylesterase
LGGLIGLMLAERHPQAIAKLMVIDVRPFMGAAFGPPGTTVESIKPVADAILAQMEGLDPAGRQQQPQVTIDGMINTVGKRKSALEDWMKSDPDVVARALHEGFVTDLSPDLSKIAVPTVVLYTTMKNNQLTDLQTDSVYQAAYKPLNGVVLKHIPDTAHFIMWDQPELFQTEVVAFLRWNFGLERKNESNEQITENSQEPNVQ